MMLRLLPSFTKKAPMIEVGMHTPQMASGRSIICSMVPRSASRKKIAARTMVATVVTA